MAKKLHFMLSRCASCYQCSFVCAKEHNWVPLVTLHWSHGLGVPITCVQCAEAPCQDACPAGAISTTADGIVVINKALCMGCGLCAMVCPFGAIHFDGGKAVKCDLCLDLLREGKVPSCIANCANMAILFDEVEELPKVQREEAARRVVEMNMQHIKLLVP